MPETRDQDALELLKADHREVEHPRQGAPEPFGVGDGRREVRHVVLSADHRQHAAQAHRPEVVKADGVVQKSRFV